MTFECFCGAVIHIEVTPGPAEKANSEEKPDVAEKAKTRKRSFTTLEDRKARWPQVPVLPLAEALAVSKQCADHPNTKKIRRPCTVPDCEDTRLCYPGMPVVVCAECFQDANIDAPDMVEAWKAAAHGFAQEWKNMKTEVTG